MNDITSELTFKGLLLCDACGADLAPSEAIIGLCQACQRTVGKRERSRGRPKGKRDARPSPGGAAPL